MRPGALTRTLDEFLWAVRREGLPVSTAQAILAARAVEAVGIERRDLVAQALSAVLVTRSQEEATFVRAFAQFWDVSASGPGQTAWDRLRAAGFSDEELSILRALLEQLASRDDAGAVVAWLDRGSELDRMLLASHFGQVDAHGGSQIGFLVHRLVEIAGGAASRRALATLRPLLCDALGARGDLLADCLAAELRETRDTIALRARRAQESRASELEAQLARRDLELVPFYALRPDEADEMRKAIRRLASRLRALARLRARHVRRGRVDPHGTLRRAHGTSGVPVRIRRRGRQLRRTKLVLLCDVSDSVRPAASFLLEFVRAAHELFDDARSFVFVSEPEEITGLLARDERRPITSDPRGLAPTSVGNNSNYGRMLRAFEARYLRELDRRTTVVVLGDARTNYFDPAADVLDRIRARARSLVWLVPEPRGLWAQGDSVMARYAPKCTRVLEVASVADLQRAVRDLSIGAWRREQTRPRRRP